MGAFELRIITQTKLDKATAANDYVNDNITKQKKQYQDYTESHEHNINIWF